MNRTTVPPVDLQSRNLQFFATPELWIHWPILPLLRRSPGKEEEYGVLFDAMGALELTGFSATVFFTNMFELPQELEAILQLPKEVFDTPEEIFAAGWRVD